MTELPPWREISTEDYYPRDCRGDPGSDLWISASKIIHALLLEQHEGRCRVTLTLRETHDMKPDGRRDPANIWDFAYGPDIALSFAEIVMVSKEGRRHRMVKTVDPKRNGPGAP